MERSLTQPIRTVYKVQHLPIRPTFIVLVECTISQQGDNLPVEFFETVLIETEEDLKAWILARDSDLFRRPYKIFRASPVGVNKVITLEVPK